MFAHIPSFVLTLSFRVKCCPRARYCFKLDFLVTYAVLAPVFVLRRVLPFRSNSKCGSDSPAQISLFTNAALTPHVVVVLITPLLFSSSSKLFSALQYFATTPTFALILGLSLHTCCSNSKLSSPQYFTSNF